MTKKILIVTAAVFFLFACSPRKRGDNEKPIVTVSIIPQKTFVEKIAGDDFDIQVLVPHGASPESYTLVPSQLKQISHSGAWFRLGYIGFELSLFDKVKEINRNMQIVDLSEGLDLIRGEEIHHGDHTHPGGVDPHFWVSPKRVKQMAEKMAEALGKIQPERNKIYQENYRKFAGEIDRLDAEISNALRDYQGKAFVTFHPSLTYFAHDYGLVQYTLESGGKEPTSQHMAKVIDLAREQNIKVIYIQSEFDNENARVFAEEIKGKIIEVKPLSPDWAKNLLEMTNLFIENF